MVIVTGGDDQAVCVAEVELHDYDTSMKPFDEDSPQGRETSCLDERTSPENRCGNSECALQTSARQQVTFYPVHLLQKFGTVVEAIYGSIRKGAPRFFENVRSSTGAKLPVCLDQNLRPNMFSNIASRTAVLFC